jgi:hypothetical protein
MAGALYNPILRPHQLGSLETDPNSGAGGRESQNLSLRHQALCWRPGPVSFVIPVNPVLLPSDKLQRRGMELGHYQPKRLHLNYKSHPKSPKPEPQPLEPH